MHLVGLIYETVQGCTVKIRKIFQYNFMGLKFFCLVFFVCFCYCLAKLYIPIGLFSGDGIFSKYDNMRT